jgi:outer membrane protein assembly factor BamA
VEGKFSPHEAFAIGGTNSVRGYEEGAVGSGRSYAVGSGEVSCRMVSFLVSLLGSYVFMLFNWPHMAVCDTSVSV